MRTLMLKSKTIFLCVCLIALALITAGCGNRVDAIYHGDYPELYSVAINSLLGAWGYAKTEIVSNSYVEKIEEDGYGRVLFAYCEVQKLCTALLIMQESDETHAYFYPDYNFVSVDYKRANSEGKYKECFTDEQIQTLKDNNDWGTELNESKYVKVKIVNEKEAAPLKEAQLKKMYEDTLKKEAYDYSNVYMVFLTADDYNRSIYLAKGCTVDYKQNVYAVVIADPDGEYSTMRFTDMYNYQEQLKAFKDLNNWNKPL